MLTLVSEDIERYAVDHTTPLPDYLQELTDYTYENMSIPQMLSGPIEGTFSRPSYGQPERSVCWR